MNIPIIVGTLLLIGLIVFSIQGRREAKARAKAFLSLNPTLIDVRSPAEYQAGHIPGAINIPVDTLQSKVGELGDKGQPIGLYCQSGARAGVAELTLIASGFTKVMNLRGIGTLRAALKESGN